MSNNSAFLVRIVLVSISLVPVFGKSVNPQPFERIITEYDDVLKGVSVDYRYNESANPNRELSNGLPSVPGCPKSEEGHPWVYYGNPSKCYLAGTRGPCDWERRLFVEEGSPNGICGCECLDHKHKPVNKKDARFCNKGRAAVEYVFLPELKQCYDLYDQGPCKDGEWIVKANVTRGAPTTRCEKRKCPEGRIPDPNMPGSCYAVGITYAGPSSLTPNDCESGKKYSRLLRLCIEKFDSFI